MKSLRRMEHRAVTDDFRTRRWITDQIGCRHGTQVTIVVVVDTMSIMIGHSIQQSLKSPTDTERVSIVVVDVVVVVVVSVVVA